MIHHAALSFSVYCGVRYTDKVWKQVVWKHSGGKPNQYWNVRERSPDPKKMSKSHAKINSYYWCETGFLVMAIG